MRTFLRRMRARLKYPYEADQLARELDTHHEMAADDAASRGLNPDEARRLARRRLGNVTLAREEARAVWVARWADELSQDLRYGARALAREWSFTLIAITTLSVGTGVLISVFTVFNAIYLRSWPIRDARRVFGISERLANPAPGENVGAFSRISYAVWKDVQAGLTTADLTAKYDYKAPLRTSPTSPARPALVGVVDDRFEQTLGLAFELGRLASDASPPAIALSHAAWMRMFDGSPAALGRTIWLGDHAVVVTGVLDRRFRGFMAGDGAYEGLVRLNQTHAWLTDAPDLLTSPTACCVDIFGRLREGATREQAAKEIEGRTNAVHAALGLPALVVVPWGTEMGSQPTGVRNTVPRVFALLFAGCGIVTLLACANIGNLQLARGLRRTRELSVRLSLGAGRLRIVRQLMTESALLAVAAGLIGFGIAWIAPSAIIPDDELPVVYTPDAMVTAFAILVGIAVTVLFGLAPALRVTRIDWRGASHNVVGQPSRLRGGLLAMQVALSLALVASAALLARGAWHAASGANAGFEFRDLHAYRFAQSGGEPDRAGRVALRSALEGDASLALADESPWLRGQPTPRVSATGRQDGVNVQWIGLNRTAIVLLKFPLLSGQWPSTDVRLREVAVSRSLARALWQNDDAIGRTIVRSSPNGDETFTVVGLMDEIRYARADAMPAVLAAHHSDWLPTVLGRAGLATQLQAMATQFALTVRVFDKPVLSDLRALMETTFVGASVASGLGLAALLLATLGVFGVFAYVVEERRRDIGARLALGANRRHVAASVLTATRGPVAIGLVAGVALALVGGIVLRTNLHGLSIVDPLSYLSVVAIFGVAALTATFEPLRRALRVSPTVTLRTD